MRLYLCHCFELIVAIFVLLHYLFDFFDLQFQVSLVLLEHLILVGNELYNIIHRVDLCLRFFILLPHCFDTLLADTQLPFKLINLCLKTLVTVFVEILGGHGLNEIISKRLLLIFQLLDQLIIELDLTLKLFDQVLCIL